MKNVDNARTAIATARAELGCDDEDVDLGIVAESLRDAERELADADTLESLAARLVRVTPFCKCYRCQLASEAIAQLETALSTKCFRAPP